MINKSIYNILLVSGVILITFFGPWWLIVILCAVLSYLYDGSLLAKSALVTATTTTAWLVIGGWHEMTTTIKASQLIGKIFNDISPTVVYTVTGIIISLPSVMATGFGHALKNLFRTGTSQS